jgi:hypothetical protein
VEQNCEAGQNPPRVVAPWEEEKDYTLKGVEFYTALPDYTAS